ncbi:MAG: metallophosphoesterase [Lentisphaerae bacterium]|nr:metallophosphoesterase [Lentisphaerota bacterium]MCP4100372.1 metallophosphoesterase [Lentisphaerota bacterium]
MKIIHFSDPHAGGSAEDWMAYVDKRWVGVFNYRFRRRFRHDLTKLELAVNYILDTKPDIAICTGDLTSTGQPGEFEKVRPILQPLRDSKVPVLYVPGNHDYYVRRPKCVNAMKGMIKWLTNDNYGFDDMPLKRTYGDVDFYLINCSWPSNLLCSWGFLKPDSVKFLQENCPAEKKRPRILVNHYPIIEDHPITRMRHRLFGQGEVVKMLEDGRLDISLVGHVHNPYSKLDSRGRGENCAGSVTRNGTISEIEYSANEDIFNFSKIDLN